MFFFFHRILYPLHICILHNILYPHSIILPASVLQTSAFDIYYKLLLFFSFLSSHTLSQKASLSSATVFMLRKCNFSCSIFFLCVCVLLSTKTTVELHVRCYMSLSKRAATCDRGFFSFFGGNFRIRLDVRVYSMRDVHSCWRLNWLNPPQLGQCFCWMWLKRVWAFVQTNLIKLFNRVYTLQLLLLSESYKEEYEQQEISTCFYFIKLLQPFFVLPPKLMRLRKSYVTSPF